MLIMVEVLVCDVDRDRILFMQSLAKLVYAILTAVEVGVYNIDSGRS